MSPSRAPLDLQDAQARKADAERQGYTFVTRHQPQADFEEPDWIVIVRRPDGRLLFPGAVDSDQSAALARGLALAEHDLSGRTPDGR